MAGRTIAIGDIHGCSKALRALLEAVNPDADDVVIPLGDYIDRGDDSRGVIEQMIELQARCQLIPLLGNHETMLLGALEDPAELAFWGQCGGAATLHSYGGSIDGIPSEHLTFIKNCRRHHETDTHLFLHANYQSNAPLQKQPDQLLFWEHLSYNMPRPHCSGKIAIVGHTPQPSGDILDMGHVKCIDTYCFGGRWLTALDVDTGDFWQANNHGELRAAV